MCQLWRSFDLEAFKLLLWTFFSSMVDLCATSSLLECFNEILSYDLISLFNLIGLLNWCENCSVYRIPTPYPLPYTLSLSLCRAMRTKLVFGIETSVNWLVLSFSQVSQVIATFMRVMVYARNLREASVFRTVASLPQMASLINGLPVQQLPIRTGGALHCLQQESPISIW